MDNLFVLAIPFFAPIIIGFTAGRLARKPAEALGWLNFFVLYVALPPVFYQVIAKTPVAQLASGAFILGTTLASFIAYCLAATAALVALRRAREAAIAGGIGGYGNVGYMGPGLALAFLGQPAAAPMALIFACDSLLFFTLMPLLVALADGADLRHTLRLIVVRVALNPFLIAIAAGVLGAAFEVQAPLAVERSLEMLKSAAAPAALFALGVIVAQRPAGQLPAETVVALVVKLVLHPMIVLVVLSILGDFDPLWVYTAVMMAALPPALSTFVMGTQFNAYVGRASTAILVGTLLSIPTLLTWLHLLQTRRVPINLFPT